MHAEHSRQRLALGPLRPRAGVGAIAALAEDESGATIIDYAFLIGLVAMAALQAFYEMGTAIRNLFDSIAAAYTQALAPSP